MRTSLEVTRSVKLGLLKLINLKAFRADLWHKVAKKAQWRSLHEVRWQYPSKEHDGNHAGRALTLDVVTRPSGKEAR